MKNCAKKTSISHREAGIAESFAEPPKNLPLACGGNAIGQENCHIYDRLVMLDLEINRIKYDISPNGQLRNFLNSISSSEVTLDTWVELTSSSYNFSVMSVTLRKDILRKLQR